MDTDLDRLIFDSRFKGLLVDAEKELYKSYVRKIVKLKLEQGTYYATELQDKYNEFKTLSSQSKKDKEYYFITICPFEDLEISKLIKTMEKVLKKKWLKKYIYVYEQRQHEPDKPFYGIHTHIITERDGIAKSDVIREVYNTCKNICGSKQSIDVKLINTQKDLQIHLNYILGQKSTKEKQQKQEIDKVFREYNKLSSSYVVGEWDDIIAMSQSKGL